MPKVLGKRGGSWREGSLFSPDTTDAAVWPVAPVKCVSDDTAVLCDSPVTTRERAGLVFAPAPSPAIGPSGLRSVALSMAASSGGALLGTSLSIGVPDMIDATGLDVSGPPVCPEANSSGWWVVLSTREERRRPPESCPERGASGLELETLSTPETIDAVGSDPSGPASCPAVGASGLILAPFSGSDTTDAAGFDVSGPAP